MKKKVFKNILKFSFFVSFIILSIQSISSYLRGEVNIENINELNEDLVFPSITICPRPKEAIINLKTDRLAADLNISIERTLTGQIFELISLSKHCCNSFFQILQSSTILPFFETRKQ